MSENNSSVRALVVDDEADIRELIEITLARMAIETTAVASLDEAFAALAATPFDLCLTDMRLPDGDGTDLVAHISDVQPACPVAVITAYGSAATAVASLKAGAFDFVCKPIDIAVLRRLVGQALKLAPPRPHDDAGTPGTRSATSAPQLLGASPAMQHVRRTIAKLARSQAPVCISGESGTGKELVARSIHAAGPRADAEFIAVNCGAIPADLMESEFFGYRKGAFTGADRDHAGLVRQADGGTLFLDEIGELPLAMQVKLLRVIQERAVRHIGTTSEQPVDMRIICATNRDLAREVAAGHFREDLFYRLNVIEVTVPPLRAHGEDIAELASAILARLQQQLQLATRPQLSTAAMAALQAHSFPGNIRELENILERAVTLCDDAIIGPDFLRLEVPRSCAHNAAAAPPAALATGAALEDQLDALQRQRIEDALVSTRYNKTRAAKVLGITFRALRYRMEKLGIE